MTRQWHTGFELNSSTAGIEMDVCGATITTSNVRSGTYAADCTGNPQMGFSHQFRTAGASNIHYLQAYIYVVSYPTYAGGAEPPAFLMLDGAGRVLMLCMNSSGRIELWTNGLLQLATGSTLSVGQYYRIAMKYRAATTSNYVTVQLDGVEDIAEISATGVGNVEYYRVRGGFGAYIATSTGGEIIVDDVGVNDDSGSFENTWLDRDEMIHLRPNAAGDNTQWSRGGTDSGANWSQVDEVTPNDATDWNLEATVNEIDDYNIDATPAALAADDTIRCVSVGCRVLNSGVSGLRPQGVVRIKASSGGTVEESSLWEAGQGTWRTHGYLDPPRVYLLTLYDLPGASTTAWTKADLDVAQIGARRNDQAVAYNTNMTVEWLLVSYVEHPLVASFMQQPQLVIARPEVVAY